MNLYVEAVGYWECTYQQSLSSLFLFFHLKAGTLASGPNLKRLALLNGAHKCERFQVPLPMTLRSVIYYAGLRKFSALFSRSVLPFELRLCFSSKNQTTLCLLHLRFNIH